MAIQNAAIAPAKPEPFSTAYVQDAVNTVAATLILNGLSPEDRYDAFDADEDGQVLVDDLQNAVKTFYPGRLLRRTVRGYWKD